MMNLAATHFIKALGIPTSSKSKCTIHGSGGKGKWKWVLEGSDFEGDDSGDEGSDDDVDKYNNNDKFDIEVNTEIEATSDDIEAMLGMTITDFKVGNVIGKVMAFVNQLWPPSKPTQDFLKQLCCNNECLLWDLKLWVRTHWGSLSNLFEVVLSMCVAIDDFCTLADGKSNLPPWKNPSHGKTSSWRRQNGISLTWHINVSRYCPLQFTMTPADSSAQIPVNSHSQLSAENMATAHKVYPLIIQLITKWEEYLKDSEFALVYKALEAGLANIDKWYWTIKDTMMYFITHSNI